MSMLKAPHNALTAGRPVAGCDARENSSPTGSPRAPRQRLGTGHSSGTIPPALPNETCRAARAFWGLRPLSPPPPLSCKRHDPVDVPVRTAVTHRRSPLFLFLPSPLPPNASIPSAVRRSFGRLNTSVRYRVCHGHLDRAWPKTRSRRPWHTPLALRISCNPIH
jgi:hypothetical protein